MAPPDDDLEARVERLEEQLSKTMPSRRQLLAGAGTLGVGALLGGGADTAAAADGTQDTSDGTVRGNGGGVDIRLDEALDPGGDEVFDVDDTGAINAAVSGREFRFDSVKAKSLRNDVDPTEYPGSDFGERWNNMIADVGRANLRVSVPKGTYTVSTVADCTDTSNLVVDLTACEFQADGVPTIFECLGMRESEWRGGRLTADSGGSTNQGWLLGRTDDGNGSEKNRGSRNKFYSPKTTTSAFNNAAIYSVGAELTDLYSPSLLNSNSGGYVLANSANNVLGASGTNATLLSSVSSNFGTIKGGRLNSSSNEGNAVVLNEGGNSIDIHRTYLFSQGEPYLELDCANNSIFWIVLSNVAGEVAESTAITDGAIRILGGTQVDNLHIGESSDFVCSQSGTNQPFITDDGNSPSFDNWQIDTSVEPRYTTGIDVSGTFRWADIEATRYDISAGSIIESHNLSIDRTASLTLSGDLLRNHTLAINPANLSVSGSISDDQSAINTSSGQQIIYDSANTKWVTQSV